MPLSKSQPTKAFNPRHLHTSGLGGWGDLKTGRSGVGGLRNSGGGGCWGGRNLAAVVYTDVRSSHLQNPPFIAQKLLAIQKIRLHPISSPTQHPRRCPVNVPTDTRATEPNLTPSSRTPTCRNALSHIKHRAFPKTIQCTPHLLSRPDTKQLRRG